MSSTVVLSFQPPTSLIADIRQTPAVPIKLRFNEHVNENKVVLLPFRKVKQILANSTFLLE